MRHPENQKQKKTAQPIELLSTPGLGQRRKQIKLLCDAIVHEFHPDKIVLFGSYAYGKPRADSDIDLLVVMPFDGSPFRQASLILGHVVKMIGVLPLDILVRTMEQIKERMEIGDSFIREIMERGKVIYEADRA